MKKKLLVIDDDNNTRELLYLEFLDEGYQIFVAKNAFKGLDVLQKNNIDLVMLDIKMPGMDGIEALERIRAINGRLPIVIYSAYHNCKDNYLTWGASDYLVKSADLDPLKKAIAKHLLNT
ncbi:MAG: response regulator [Proteobacteria bacterium]|nr:response regulator [Pseudomonadota bacterium]